MRYITVLAAVLVLSANVNAQQQPLATIDLFGSGGIRGMDTGVSLFVQYNPVIKYNNTTLFNTVVWTPNMVGLSLLDTAGSEPGYANFVSLLTDGVNEAILAGEKLFPYGGGGGRSLQESRLLTTPPPGWNGIDLQGYSITGVGFTLNHLSLDVDAASNWTTWSWDATLTIYTVPEPRVLSLLLLGSFGGWWRWRLRHAFSPLRR